MRTILFISMFFFSIAIKTFGQIEGVVTDKKKIAIVNAIIIVSDTMSRAIDTVISDKRGGYAFKDLKPGKYNIEAKAVGFQPGIQKNILITLPPEGTDEGDDTYYAVRVDIILIPLKPQQ